MNDAKTTEKLGYEIRTMRQQHGLSIRRLAELADVDATWLSRVERGVYESPDARLLRSVADALGVETGPLFVAAGYEGPEPLPQFGPYLRAKYDMPPEAVAQLEAHFELFNERFDREGRHG